MFAKRPYLTRLIIIPALLFLLFFEWVMVPSFIGSCKLGDSFYTIINVAYYISVVSIVVTIILILLFLKKSDKFFGIFIVISCVFVLVIPYVIVLFSGENTCKSDAMWESFDCLERDKNGNCIEYTIGDEENE